MLAICSDLDETPDRHVYRQIMRFLNTTETTAMGPGVGLEVGNSIYFDMPPDQFAYWNTDDAGREMVQTLIRSGHIDCLHSYGDLAATRTHVGRALDELCRHDCRLPVWVDHSVAPTNFGAGIMCGHGDEEGHPAYHADLTLSHGVRYVWRGRVTSVLGQAARARLGGIFTAAHPLASGLTLAKEASKRVLARLGRRKYAIHGPNKVLRPVRLRDGQATYEFLRSNPHWGGVSCCETARGIGQVLTADMLKRLEQRGGCCVLYTHLGKVRDPRVPFDASAVAGFRRLAEAHDSGKVLVTTTRRLLGYRRAAEEVTWTCRCYERDGCDESDHPDESDGKSLRIEVETGASGNRKMPELEPEDLAGLTFYVDEPQRTCVFVDGREVPELQSNGPDETGRPSVSLPWRTLEFPSI